MLTVEDVVTTYGAVRALDGVSLQAQEGTITAVLGANGAGKTTLLRTVNGLVRPLSGRITYAGRDLLKTRVENVVHAGIAHVPEGRGVITELTVEENLRLGGLWRRERDDRGKALGEVYDLFPRLGERRRSAASSLSGGARQMLSIGRALMGRPKMLLLDEPSLGLAPVLATQIMRRIRSLRDDTGLTVLLVEQNAKSALAIADRGIVLNLGRVVASEDARQLAADEQLRAAYLGF